MGLFDRVKCEYPLPDPKHQDLEFQTKSLESMLDNYTITCDGRLVRHARSQGIGPERDVEWPIHGDIRIYGGDPDKERGFIDYKVRFTHGRVEWVRRVDEKGRFLEPPPTSAPPVQAAEQELTPDVWGRRLTVEEFRTHTPEKLELIGGEMPGAEKLLVLLLTQLGLRRAAALVSLEQWKKVLTDDE